VFDEAKPLDELAALLGGCARCRFAVLLNHAVQ
jgi:hypothetical protein